MLEIKIIRYRLMAKFLCLLFLCFTATCSTIHLCQSDHYWSTVLLECRPCSDVCAPATRPPCSDFCPDVYIQLKNQSSSTTAITKIMSTTSQPVPADYARFNDLPLIPVGLLLLIGSVIAMFFVVSYVRNTKVRNAHRRRREDVENGNGPQGIELQPLNGTAVQQGNGNPGVDENGDGNREGDTSGTWVYEPEHDCLRIRDLDNLPQQRAQQPDSLERNNNSH